MSPQKSGFTYTLAVGAGAAAGPNDCNGTATNVTYYTTAIPTSFASTGNRSFASNQAGAIWQNVRCDGAARALRGRWHDLAHPVVTLRFNEGPAVHVAAGLSHVRVPSPPQQRLAVRSASNCQRVARSALIAVTRSR